MISLTEFLLFQLLLIVFVVVGYLLYNLIRKNRKLEKIVNEQNSYMLNLYETIKMIEVKIKEIDRNGLFHSDDDVGFFFQGVKAIQEQLSEYIKFMK